MTVKILVVDDHVLVREGLRRALIKESDFALVGEAASKREAFVQIPHHNPDVLVVDLHLPDGNGLGNSLGARTLTADGNCCPNLLEFPRTCFSLHGIWCQRLC